MQWINVKKKAINFAKKKKKRLKHDDIIWAATAKFVSRRKISKAKREIEEFRESPIQHLSVSASLLWVFC